MTDCYTKSTGVSCPRCDKCGGFVGTVFFTVVGKTYCVDCANPVAVPPPMTHDEIGGLVKRLRSTATERRGATTTERGESDKSDWDKALAVAAIRALARPAAMRRDA